MYFVSYTYITVLSWGFVSLQKYFVTIKCSLVASLSVFRLMLKTKNIIDKKYLFRKRTFEKIIKCLYLLLVLYKQIIISIPYININILRTTLTTLKHLFYLDQENYLLTI